METLRKFSANKDARPIQFREISTKKDDAKRNPNKKGCT